MIEPRPRLIVITDLSRHSGAETISRWQELAQAAAPGSVALQLRDKQLGIRERLELALALAKCAKQGSQWFMVNDRLDLAVLSGADGVHLGEASFEPDEARRVFEAVAKPRPWVSAALHESGQERTSADALLLSPVVEVRKGRPALGLSRLGDLAKRLRPMPIYALGGVDHGSAGRCLAAGASGVAVMGAAWGEAWYLLLEDLQIRRG